MTASEFAINEGAIVSEGINWVWANGFPTQAAAARFLLWLEENGYEHRGIYAQNKDPVTDTVTRWDVRFRR